jgi:hypothetical protein
MTAIRVLWDLASGRFRAGADARWWLWTLLQRRTAPWLVWAEAWSDRALRGGTRRPVPSLWRSSLWRELLQLPGHTLLSTRRLRLPCKRISSVGICDLPWLVWGGAEEGVDLVVRFWLLRCQCGPFQAARKYTRIAINEEVLHLILQELVKLPFFRYFKVSTCRLLFFNQCPGVMLAR